MLTNHDLTRLARFVESGEASFKRFAGARPHSGKSDSRQRAGNDGYGASGASFPRDAAEGSADAENEQLAAHSLRKLGCTKAEAEEWITAVARPGMSVEDLVVAALKRRS